MAIRKRTTQTPVADAMPSVDSELERKAEEFGRGAYAPTPADNKREEASTLDPHAPIGPQGILFRFNEYQKRLLKESADEDRRSQQKLLESIIWPELERRRAERSR